MYAVHRGRAFHSGFFPLLANAVRFARTKKLYHFINGDLPLKVIKSAPETCQDQTLILRLAVVITSFERNSRNLVQRSKPAPITIYFDDILSDAQENIELDLKLEMKRTKQLSFRLIYCFLIEDPKMAGHTHLHILTEPKIAR